MLYHKDIGFPASLRIPEGIVQLWYSIHAKERFFGKYRGSLILPSFIKITKDNIIEATTENNINCKKVMVRTRYDERRDMCIVLSPYNGKVVTIWLNDKREVHEITDKSKYNIP